MKVMATAKIMAVRMRFLDRPPPELAAVMGYSSTPGVGEWVPANA
jgi:hypothetical protein